MLDPNPSESPLAHLRGDARNTASASSTVSDEPLPHEADIHGEPAALFGGTLQLYGNVRLPGARFYRVLRDAGQETVPFTGLGWPLYRVRNGRLQENWVASDQDGWYAIQPPGDHWYPDTLLLEWQPESEGRHCLRVECADAYRNPIGEVSTRVMRVDNANAIVTYLQLSWKFGSEPDAMLHAASRSLLHPFPAIRRGPAAEAVQVMFRARVSAARFRYASIGTSGCGATDFALVADAANHASHWFSNADDGAATLQGRFELRAGAPEGAYAFNVYASQRIADEDADPLGAVSSDCLPLHISPTVPVAVVDRPPDDIARTMTRTGTRR
ncbi:MAG: hypothetical protein MNPFHGCM_02286 [Gemmatimonadaceae bacterium]|nr:hypothetical protein [Gemmatimonadaceae bacterium]